MKGNYKKCPICFGELKYEEGGMEIRGGNDFYQCLREVDHRFWENGRSWNVLWWFPGARELTNWNWYKAYVYEDGKIAGIVVNPETIGKYK